MITIDKDLLLPTGEPEPAVLGELLRLFADRQKHLKGLHQVYDRQHSIQGRRRLRGRPTGWCTICPGTLCHRLSLLGAPCLRPAGAGGRLRAHPRGL